MTEPGQLGTTAPDAAAVLERVQALGSPLLSLPGETTTAGATNWRRWIEGAMRRQLARALGVLVAQQHRPR